MTYGQIKWARALLEPRTLSARMHYSLAAFRSKYVQSFVSLPGGNFGDNKFCNASGLVSRSICEKRERQLALGTNMMAVIKAAPMYFLSMLACLIFAFVARQPGKANIGQRMAARGGQIDRARPTFDSSLIRPQGQHCMDRLNAAAKF